MFSNMILNVSFHFKLLRTQITKVEILVRMHSLNVSVHRAWSDPLGTNRTQFFRADCSDWFFRDRRHCPVSVVVAFGMVRFQMIAVMITRRERSILAYLAGEKMNRIGLAFFCIFTRSRSRHVNVLVWFVILLLDDFVKTFDFPFERTLIFDKFVNIEIFRRLNFDLFDCDFAESDKRIVQTTLIGSEFMLETRKMNELLVAGRTNEARVSFRVELKLK